MRTDRLLWTVLSVSIGPAIGAAAANCGPATIDATINGLQITVDSDSGSLVRLSYPGPGVMLESSPKNASAIDVAYPIKAFEPLRLASRYSSGARITKADGVLEIHWDKLGASRGNFDVPGQVSATVWFAALPDGQSIAMTAEVVNESDNEVRQVLFPDFPGLLPFCGENGTYFRTGGFASLPFPELARTEERESAQFMSDEATCAVEYTSGELYGKMVLRWIDFGGLEGGLSVFPQSWGFDPQVRVRLQRWETEAKLRLMYVHYVDLKKGERWKSDKYILTPHQHGWAKGIEPYRAWVKQNLKREHPVPKHVREGLGFRTVWMCQNRPGDPEDVVFQFSDLPKLAAESREHGLDELVFWAWSDFFTIPVPAAYAHLGGEQSLTDAVRECKQIGVNVVPFLSVLLANADSGPRYGANVPPNAGGWTYHTELIPRFNPPYAHGSATVQVGPCNKAWQDDVLAGTRHLVDIGIPSLCWDVTWTTNDPEPNQVSLIKQIREYAHRVDPEAVFSGEELYNLDIDAGVLDYTWNWLGYRDCQAITSVFPAPRINCNVSSSPLVVKKAFADNLYMNVMPRKPDSVNGSDWIANHPELSQALKQCAKLRKQFLPYFVDGTLIGDGILTKNLSHNRPNAGERPAWRPVPQGSGIGFKPCPAAHVCAFVLPDRAIMVIVNLGARQAHDLEVDLEPWVQLGQSSFEITQYDADGQRMPSTTTNAHWHGRTKVLAPEELTIIELIGKDGAH